MKSIALLAVTAMMWCSLALAQEQKPAAAETAKPALRKLRSRRRRRRSPWRSAKPAATRMKKARRMEEARAARRTPATALAGPPTLKSSSAQMLISGRPQGPDALCGSSGM